MAIDFDKFAVTRKIGMGRTDHGGVLDLTESNNDVLDYLIEYGAKQSAQDATAGAPRDVWESGDEKNAKRLTKAEDAAKNSYKAANNKAERDEARAQLATIRAERNKLVAAWTTKHPEDVYNRKTELFDARLADFKAGRVPERTTGETMAADPVTDEMYRLAKAGFIANKFKGDKDGRKAFNARSKAEQRDVLDKFIELVKKVRDYRKEAEENINKVAEIDLSSIEL